MDEFLHNRAILTSEDQRRIADIKIAVVGAGGLGGFVLNGLTRLGAKYITIIENDVFQPSNTNRQCFCNKDTISKSKAQTLKTELNKIFPCEITIIETRLDDKNAEDFLKNADIVFDCVDNVNTKIAIEEACLSKKIPLIHGGVDKTFGQAAIIESAPILKNFYKNGLLGENAVIMPQIISALQLNLFVKYIKNQYISNVIYYFDSVAMEIIRIKGN